jgi:inner membrane protein
MENVCHTLAGLALARGGLEKTTRLATTALVIGANLPDVDLAWSSFRSALVYYHYHRGWSHSILGFFVLTVLLWLVLLAIDRWLLAGRSTDRTKPIPLLLAGAAGVGSHILMDGANSYGIRPFLPWSGRWVYGDLWVIVDPWLWLILGVAVYRTGGRGRRRDLVWLMGAAAAAIVVLFTPVVAPLCRIAWAAGLLTAIAVCRGAAGRRSGPPAALAGLGLVLLYAGLCAASHQAALARIARMGARDPGGNAPDVAALPLPADPLRWEGIVADARTIRHGIIGALPLFAPAAAPMTALSRGLDSPEAGLLMNSCAGDVIREFFRYPFAAIETEPGDGRTLIVRDARYTRQGRGFAVHAAPLDAVGRPVTDPGECP